MPHSQVLQFRAQSAVTRKRGFRWPIVQTSDRTAACSLY